MFLGSFGVFLLNFIILSTSSRFENIIEDFLYKESQNPLMLYGFINTVFIPQIADSRAAVISPVSGRIHYVDSEKIVIRTYDVPEDLTLVEGENLIAIYLRKYKISRSFSDHVKNNNYHFST